MNAACDQYIFVSACFLLQVWFEVSAHTSRVHFHADKDGGRPLGLSLPIGCLQETETSASVKDLLEALDKRFAEPRTSAARPLLSKCLLLYLSSQTRIQWVLSIQWLLLDRQIAATNGHAGALLSLVHATSCSLALAAHELRQMTAQVSCMHMFVNNNCS